MSKNKKATRTIMAVVLCFVAFFSNMQMNLAKENYDNTLKSMGTPQSVIDEMDENYKAYICEKKVSGETYESFEEDELYNNNPSSSKLLGGINLCSVEELKSKDISVSIYATGVTIGGKKYVKLYPSFRWKKAASIKNDTFAFALYSGWECKPGSDVGLTVNAVNSFDVVQKQLELKPSDASEYGYAFGFPNTCSKLPGGGHYEGYAYFYARRKNKTATKAISMKYIHDTASLVETSYGVSIGVASVSVSSNSSKLQVYAKNVTFSYSYSTK